jgi:hypothetical protein
MPDSPPLYSIVFRSEADGLLLTSAFTIIPVPWKTVVARFHDALAADVRLVRTGELKPLNYRVVAV